MEVAAAKSQMLGTRDAFRVVGTLMLTSYLFPQSANVSNNDAFDFIVVGAGSAGAVVADRLSDCGQFSVLVIDAGGDPPIESLSPALNIQLLQSQYDWNISSKYENSKCCKSAAFNLTSGRVLGGGSSLNYMYYVRGVPDDYRHWAEAAGDSSWDWDGVYPYFIKSERLESPVILNSRYAKFHGKSGFLGITREDRPEANRYLPSFGELHDVLLDINGNQTLGYTLPLYTIADGIRQTTAYTNLRADKIKPNLKVLKNTEVIKILFDNNKNAIGIKAITSNKRRIVLRARKEVIVSAGTLNTAKLLMLSGIGPREHLESMNIKVRSDLPVGFNYHDHLTVFLSLQLEKSQAPILPVNPHKIPLPSITGYVALDKKQKYPDYQTISFVAPHDSEGPLQLCLFSTLLSDYICQNIYESGIGTNTLFSYIILLHPKSRGRVTLQSSNPKDQPKICTGTLTNKYDLETLASAIEDFVKVVNTTYFKSINAKVNNLKIKECAGFVFGSRDYWKCYIEVMKITIYHGVGTSSLGRVTDSRLRVFNVNRLRVADASVIPYVPSGNTNCPTIMIGERAAAMIKEDHKSCSCCKTTYNKLQQFYPLFF